MAGTITLFTGPMFAGKTTRLIELFDQEDTVAIKPLIDTRHPVGWIISHTGARIPCAMLGENVVSERTKKVLIDEGQFVENLREMCVMFARIGIDVYVSALNATSEQEEWPEVSKLIPVCTEIIFVRSGHCETCKLAAASHTVTKPCGAAKEGKIHIGGKNMYASVCTRCLFKMQSK